MKFLIDTNVISETIKPRPNKQVLAWFKRQTPDHLFLASMTLGELMRGACCVKDTQKSARLKRWIKDELAHQFNDRILSFDHETAIIWGELMGDGDCTGYVRSAADIQIAAIAHYHQLTLVTRNEKDFKNIDITLLNPWLK